MENKMPYSEVELFLFPLEPLHCGYGIQQGVVLPSLNYIPGRVLRGGLAGWALRNCKGLSDSDERFKKIFFAENDDDNEPPLISYPWCTFKGYQVPPLSLFKPKGKLINTGKLSPGKDGKAGDYVEDRCSKKLEKELWNTELLVDFLKKKKFPVDIETSVFEPLGSRLLNFYSGRCHATPHTELEMRAGHDLGNGRVPDDGGLWIEEVIPATPIKKQSENYFRGTLRFQKESEAGELFESLFNDCIFNEGDEKINLSAPETTHLLFLGRKRIPTVIYAGKVKDCEKPDVAAVPEQCQSITLTSDCVIGNRDGEFKVCRDNVFKYLGLEDLLSGCKVVRFFGKAGLLHGYDRESRKPLVWPTLAAGSCVVFKVDTSDYDAVLDKLKKFLPTGLGCQRRDGCGRFELNWKFHKP